MANLIHSILPQNPRAIVHVQPDVSVAQCVSLMISENIGALVVMDEHHLYGILSERDIIRSLVAKNLSPNNTKASEILCANITILEPSDTIERAMEVITFSKRHHLLVADKDKLIAVLSIGDLLYNLLENKKKQIEALENYIHK